MAWYEISEGDAELEKRWACKAIQYVIATLSSRQELEIVYACAAKGPN